MFKLIKYPVFFHIILTHMQGYFGNFMVLPRNSKIPKTTLLSSSIPRSSLLIWFPFIFSHLILSWYYLGVLNFNSWFLLNLPLLPLLLFGPHISKIYEPRLPHITLASTLVISCITKLKNKERKEKSTINPKNRSADGNTLPNKLVFYEREGFHMAWWLSVQNRLLAATLLGICGDSYYPGLLIKQGLFIQNFVCIGHPVILHVRHVWPFYSDKS